MAHQPAFDFIQADLVSIFHRTSRLTATNDVNVLFKNTHDLFRSGQLFVLQHPAGNLLYDLFGQRNIMGQCFRPSFGLLLGSLLQLLLRLFSPGDGLFREVQELLIGLLA